MSALLYKIRRHRLFVGVTAIALFFWYCYNPHSSSHLSHQNNGSFEVDSNWLNPSHSRGDTKEKLDAGWSPHDPDDAFPPAKGHPHHKAVDGAGVVDDEEDVGETDPEAPLNGIGGGAGGLTGDESKEKLGGAHEIPEDDDENTLDSAPGVKDNTKVTDDDAEKEEPLKTTAPQPPKVAPKPPVDDDDDPPMVPVRPGTQHEHTGSRPDQSLGDPYNSEGNAISLPKPTEHWRKTPEHFPIPPESIIPLPTGEPKKLPKIQFDFVPGSETESQRNTRHERQAAVKDAFKHAWEGYRKFAWGHDEVTPISGSFKDPFAGWAATLVDALDTMAIMGLHSEFEQALTGVAKIDFTTTFRNDIPLFETTIRYLGGLIGAYDVTGHKHKILLDKAVELAEVLYNAFDTPNRMPVLFFQWSPESTKLKHRSSKHACMAEIGSLSVEFTRLAQITGENKYYDAVQRITDEFDKFVLNTTLPGFWPLTLDASGCQEVEEVYTVTYTRWETPTAAPKVDGLGERPTLLPGGSPLNQIDPVPPKKQTESDDDLLDNPNFIAPSKPTQKPAGRASDEDLEADDKPSGSQSGFARLRKRVVIPAKPDDKAEWSSDSDYDHDNGNDIPLPESDNAPAPPPPLPSKKTGSKLQAGLEEMERDAAASRKDTDPNRAVSTDNPEKPAPRAKQEVLKPQPMIKTAIRTKTHCIPTGFQMNEGENKYSYGGMSDSTYEYLLKEHILLGGLVKQYERLYVQTFETGRDNLFFKPMAPGNEGLLVSGDLRVYGDYERDTQYKNLDGAGSHLTCFVGGMVGMGSRVLNRPDDLELAIKLTEGCVWNYFSTTTGIMPENFVMAQCPKTGTCKWNENEWYAMIVPPSEEIITAAKKHGVSFSFAQSPSTERVPKVWKRDVGYDGEKDHDHTSDSRDYAGVKIAKEATTTDDKESKDIKDTKDTTDTKDPLGPNTPPKFAEVTQNDVHQGDGVSGHDGHHTHDPLSVDSHGDDEVSSPTGTGDSSPPLIPSKPEPPQKDAYENWLDNVKEQLKYTRLPEGYISMGDTRYILRPEAIESVFYMYRITGDKTWQDKGWKMFQAVEKYTKTPIAHSALSDVMDDKPRHLDSMESFWLAETLKYYYLLFSEPNLISLDDYVLNTEAHPLSRPKPKAAGAA